MSSLRFTGMFVAYCSSDDCFDEVGRDSTKLAGLRCYHGQEMNGTLQAVARRFLILSACLFVAVVAPQILDADVVHLTNGRTMEGVILEQTPDRVVLQLAFGEIGLPRSSVDRIEPGRSPLQEYLERRSGLEQGQGTASEWLELALWADREGLDHNAREATLMAARLDPGLPGLDPLMTALGYEYEENLAVWMSHDEIMRRRGYVLSNGRWLSPSQAAAFKRAQEAAEAGELERQRRDRLARAMEMLVLTQIAQAEESRRLREEASAIQYGLPLWGGYPVVVAPGYWPRPPLRPEPRRRGHGSGPRRTNSATRNSYRDALVSRPPGSFIPVSPVESHHGGLQRPPDSQ